MTKERPLQYLIDRFKHSKQDCETALEQAERLGFRLLQPTAQGDVDITEQHYKEPLRREIDEYRRAIEDLESDE